jgi:hypothetical protein
MHLPYDTLLALLDEACPEWPRPDLGSDDVRPMSWDDARRLRQRGFELGAHGVRHAILTREPPETARQSIRDSLARVAAEVGGCSTFAIPNGNYTAELALYAQACGATTVMTVEPTWADAARPLWCLPRVQIFGRDHSGRIGWKLALAATGCVLPNPDGTGREYTWRSPPARPAANGGRRLSGRLSKT